MCGAFHQSCPSETDQTGVLQPAWWTTRGEQASQKRLEEGKILRKVARLWGRTVIHIWDRGFAGSPWTTLALDHRLRFILRWNKQYHLVGSEGRKQEGWKIARGRRSWTHRMVWDARRRCQRKTGVIAFPVHLPEDERKLFLVVSRPGPGRKPWYLITNETIHTPEPMPDAGKLRCPYALPNLRWHSNLPVYSIGSLG